MKQDIVLHELDESYIDTVLSLSDSEKTIFFDKLITTYYPHIEKNSKDYNNLQIHYRGCWVMEKLYRNNEFMKQCFSMVYTRSGLIRNLWNDLYYINEDDLIIH